MEQQDRQPTKKTKSKCPEKLEAILERIRALPLEIKEQDWNERLKMVVSDLQGQCDPDDINGIESIGIRHLFGEFIDEINSVYRDSDAELIASELAVTTSDDYFADDLGNVFMPLSNGKRVVIDGTFAQRIAAVFDDGLAIAPTMTSLQFDKLDGLWFRRAVTNLQAIFKVSNGLITLLNDIVQEGGISRDRALDLTSRLHRLNRYCNYKFLLSKEAFIFTQTLEDFEARQCLRLIAESDQGRNPLNTFNSRAISVRVNLEISGTEILGVKSDFFEAIEGVDPSRIRSCVICKNIFWAARSDSKTCSPDCTNSFQQRKFRQSNRDKINRDRRENYRVKKLLRKNKRRRS